MTTPFQFYLASQSPRRAALLSQIGYEFQQFSVDIDETVLAGESPQEAVARLALEKAKAGWSQSQRELDCPVLAADTLVAVDGQLLGKPKDENDAIDMLLKLSGRSHQVLTAVAVIQDQQLQTACSISEVTFATITAEQAKKYWQTGEPQDKAGAYAIQGRAGVWVKSITGSYSGIVGLPLYETSQCLQQFGVQSCVIFPA